MPAAVLDELWEVIESRKQSRSPDSWTSSLLDKGTTKICKKIGEESTEVVIAALAEEKKDVISESADLLYHLFVLWADQNIVPDMVYHELKKRFDLSGIEEKNSRKGEK